MPVAGPILCKDETAFEVQPRNAIAVVPGPGPCAPGTGSEGMNRSTCGVVLGLLLVGISPIHAAEGGWSYDGNLRYQTEHDRFWIDIINRVQGRLTVDDPSEGESGQSFDLNRYRLLLRGQITDDWEFLVQSDLATGSLSDDEIDSNLLLDAEVRFVRKPLAQVRIGQGKVAFGRQSLIDSDRFQFVDRSIATLRFTHLRDVGVALVGENTNGTYGYSVGLYNGNGINTARDENKDYMATARLEVTPLGPMALEESDPDWTRQPESRLHLAVAVMTNNQGEGSFEEERVHTGVLEVAYRVRGFSLAAEFFTESTDPLLADPAEETDADGWYIQAGYMFPMTEQGRLEIAGRYSEVLRDIANADETEIGLAVGWYFKSQRQKVQFDIRDLDYEGIPFGDRVDTEEGRLQVQFIF
jgi:phosphate-selective porin